LLKCLFQHDKNAAPTLRRLFIAAIHGYALSMDKDGEPDSLVTKANAPTERAKAPARPERRRLSGKLRYILSGISAAFLLFVCGFMVFAYHVASMRPSANPPISDAIIVLTGGFNRLETGLQLLKDGKAKRLLISGVYPRTRRSDIRRATGADPELFACCIDIDRTALDTIGNASESAKWLQSKGFHKVLLVTNNYHMPRSLLETRRVFRGVEVYPQPVVTREIGLAGWLTRPNALRVLVTEYVKYLAALVHSVIPPSWDKERETRLAVTENGAVK
jgi:uncharacterized SAM-binding protein YcdF (DUF218 family)